MTVIFSIIFATIKAHKFITKMIPVLEKHHYFEAYVYFINLQRLNRPEKLTVREIPIDIFDIINGQWRYSLLCIIE